MHTFTITLDCEAFDQFYVQCKEQKVCGENPPDSKQLDIYLINLKGKKGKMTILRRDFYPLMGRT